MFPKLVWNRDAQGGRYSPPDGDGHASARPSEHRDYGEFDAPPAPAAAAEPETDPPIGS